MTSIDRVESDTFDFFRRKKETPTDKANVSLDPIRSHNCTSASMDFVAGQTPHSDAEEVHSISIEVNFLPFSQPMPVHSYRHRFLTTTEHFFFWLCCSGSENQISSNRLQHVEFF